MIVSPRRSYGDTFFSRHLLCLFVIHLVWVLLLSIQVSQAHPPSVLQLSVPVEQVLFPRCDEFLNLSQVQRENIEAIESSSELIDAELNVLKQARWLPQAPQLRARTSRGLEGDDIWRGRLGIRWYIPHFSIPRDVQDKRIETVLKELTTVFERTARIPLAYMHLAARRRWLTWTTNLIKHRLWSTKYKLLKDLAQSGSINQLQVRRALAQVKLSQLAEQRSRHAWQALYQNIITRPPSEEPLKLSSRFPLAERCVSPPSSEDVKKRLLTSPPLRSLRELLLTLALMKEKRTEDRRWIDFIEVSYDQQPDRSRMIAEIGIDLPNLDSRRQLDQRTRTLKQRQLHEMRLGREQEEKTLLAELQALLAEEPSTDYSPDPPHFISDQIPIIEIEMIELEIWKQAWSDQLSFEEVHLRWVAAHDYPW